MESLWEQQQADQFIVDDLLDLSNDDVEVEDEAADAATDGSTVTVVDNSCCSNSFSGDLGDHELCDPYEDRAELEWLSKFEEECFSTEDLEKLHLISGGFKAGYPSQPSPSPAVLLPEAPVPGKARSKRSRTAPCSWSSRLLAPATPPDQSELFLPELSPSSPPRNLFAIRKMHKPAKKKDATGAPSDGRRCLHCATDRTPQWRTGPMGPKTLCNACGVRYKSGRLVPEYRPAASPTFALSKHSNSHRKVLELRRHKEIVHFMSDNHGVYDSLVATSGGDEFLQMPHHMIGTDFGQLI